MWHNRNFMKEEDVVWTHCKNPTVEHIPKFTEEDCSTMTLKYDEGEITFIYQDSLKIYKPCMEITTYADFKEVPHKIREDWRSVRSRRCQKHPTAPIETTHVPNL